MSRESVLMGVLTIDPTSTSDLYERAGYGALAEVGMISYHEFRGELEKLQAAGVVESSSGDDGSTLWSLTAESAAEG
ncbi:MAG TPA: hypothetical protein VMB27_02335 [Solirubrobacteraceae bacterium]|nr:hypothetical protein [Solirubrobacteraceae bacterium]